jgi:hypothetical protein
MTRTEPWHPTHIHKKGKLYRLFGYGHHTETREEGAIYEDSHGGLHFRPRATFDEPDRYIPLPEGTRHVASFPPGTQFATWGPLHRPKAVIAAPPDSAPVMIYMDGRVEEVTTWGPEGQLYVYEAGAEAVTIEVGTVGENEKPGG